MSISLMVYNGENIKHLKGEDMNIKTQVKTKVAQEAWRTETECELSTGEQYV